MDAIDAFVASFDSSPPTEYRSVYDYGSAPLWVRSVKRFKRVSRRRKKMEDKESNLGMRIVAERIASNEAKNKAMFRAEFFAKLGLVDPSLK